MYKLKQKGKQKMAMTYLESDIDPGAVLVPIEFSGEMVVVGRAAVLFVEQNESDGIHSPTAAEVTDSLHETLTVVSLESVVSLPAPAKSYLGRAD